MDYLFEQAKSGIKVVIVVIVWIICSFLNINVELDCMENGFCGA
ncbi:hypothetical protein [Kiloniella litopenaei]